MYAADKQKQAVMDSWRIAFPTDSEAFVQFYFEKIYRNENTLLYLEEDKVVSCLQMLPHKITYGNKLINASYISGAATLPEYKNQGLMGKLLTHSFGEMKLRGEDISILIPQEPWLIDFYSKRGYSSCFEYELTGIHPDDYPSFPDKMQVKALEFCDLKYVYNFYKKHFAIQNLCVQKSRTAFSIMVEECQLFEGNVYVLINKEAIVGLCFCFCSGGKVILKDCITKNKDYQTYFLSKLTRKFKNQSIFLYSPVSNPDNAVFLGMVRIIDAYKILKLFSQSNPHLSFSVKVNDGYIPENNKTFFASDGEVSESTSGKTDFQVSIKRLAQLLFGFRISSLKEKYHIFPPQHPYMSLMLE